MSGGVAKDLNYRKGLYVMKDIVEEKSAEVQRDEITIAVPENQQTKMPQGQQDMVPQVPKEGEKASVWKALRKNVLIPLIPSIVTGILTGIVILVGTVFYTSYRVDTLADRVSAIDGKDGKLDKLETKMEDMESDSMNQMESRLSASISGVEYRVTEDLKEAKDQFTTALGFVKCFPTTGGLSGMPNVNINIELKTSNSNPSWASTQTIATDADTGEKYQAEELINKRILMPYTEDGTEVYFFGQYNSKKHWDGDCTINVYKDNKLILITDAVYKDGKLQRYKQALPDSNSDGDRVWIISNRVCKEKVNKGVSISYYADELPDKAFDLKSVEIKNIISVREFQASLKSGIEGYYCGDTSNGRYNDGSGKAYMAKYFRDGTTKMLYRGEFHDGSLSDSSNDAWYIVREKNTDYMYYMGPFENNTAKWKSDKYFQYHLSLKKINELIKGYTFDCSLKWRFGEIG